MSLEMVLIAAMVSTAGPARLNARPAAPFAFREGPYRHERVAQLKGDTTAPGGLPGRSETSEEAKPRTRAARPKAAKPAAGDTSSKDKPREDRKKPLDGGR
jgi:hypothetical protein